jgi:hypothetical protein
MAGILRASRGIGQILSLQIFSLLLQAAVRPSLEKALEGEFFSLSHLSVARLKVFSYVLVSLDEVLKYVSTHIVSKFSLSQTPRYISVLFQILLSQTQHR